MSFCLRAHTGLFCRYDRCRDRVRSPGLLHYVISYWGHTFGILVEADIRHDLFRHMQELSFDYYDRNRTGQLMSRLTADLFDITEARPSWPGGRVYLRRDHRWRSCGYVPDSMAAGAGDSGHYACVYRGGLAVPEFHEQSVRGVEAENGGDQF